MNELGTLRPIRATEIELMHAWRNEPAVRTNMYTQHVISLEEHLVWWERTSKKTDQRYFMYEIDRIPAGIAAFTDIDLKNENSAWAFYASPTAPRGTGSRMEFLMLDRAFDELKVKKLYCEVLAFNTQVVKLHQKFGFKIEGVFRNQHKVNEDFVDIIRLGIFADEWRQDRDAMQQKLIGQTRA